MPIDRQIVRASGLLFGSGLCSLIYQMVWLREFRLVFGGSTSASAAVLSVFLGGLGIGGIWLGRRADLYRRPLELYAYLELLIAVLAAVSPFLIALARGIYIGLGGEAVLGSALATWVRIALTALVLAAPTLLMGGTLPAAARAFCRDEDMGRHRVASLYSANTLGAVGGTLAATFLLLECLGARGTLWLACGVNAVIGVLALRMSREIAFVSLPLKQSDLTEGEGAVQISTPRVLVFAAAAVAGFVFLLMELVWYRMLSPLLGGTTYTFGLILATGLLGVGLGGGLYALSGRRSPTFSSLALSCGLEALCIAIPYSLGDRVAVMAGVLGQWSGASLGDLVSSWTAITGLVVLPAAVAAGYQFPLLIALLGSAGHRLGRDVGWAYAWNTLGTILGAAIGGFVLLPWLSAPGAWRLAIALLSALGLGLAAYSIGKEGGPAWARLFRRPGLSVASALFAVALTQTTGPTAAWRHSPIGAGLAPLYGKSANEIRDWLHQQRRAVFWEREGRESAVALRTTEAGPALLLNGKSDGSAAGDAPTQIMGGMVGAILHPHPRTALVIGLGTGSSAGWLAAIPAVDRVDVAELEAAVVEAAPVFAPVNRDVLHNPKVHLLVGDAREVVLAGQQRYDVIFSEPSNPFRAGVSSLYTQEFYQGIAARLQEEGLFLQWLQAYEINQETIQTIYATLSSVFPCVETWQTKKRDLLLVATAHPLSYDIPGLRARIREEPYCSALATAWRATDLEGFLAHFVAGPGIGRIWGGQAPLNTDDRTRVEYALARSLGSARHFDIGILEALGREHQEDRPQVVRGDMDWVNVQRQRIAFLIGQGERLLPNRFPQLTLEQGYRLQALAAWQRNQTGAALEWWSKQTDPPVGLFELLIVAAIMAHNQRPEALQYAEQLRVFHPAEADIIVAILRTRQGRHQEAIKALESAFEHYRTDPWLWPPLLEGALALALDLGTQDPLSARRLYEALQAPFAMDFAREERLETLLNLSFRLATPRECVSVLEQLEPYVPWKGKLLEARVRFYRAAAHPNSAKAQRDLEEYRALEGG
ncbi:MAG: spermidine synthase [Candidatus Latescibacteria bacterium]|nr:spermidine synthase [Candidatus Latescibacterota bacterium]